MTFKELGIIEPILKAITAEGYINPTPIQGKSIPILLKGRDLLGCAQTGTGKTAAFGIPILQHLYNDRGDQRNRKIRALVVTPTRELAIQIADSFTNYGKFTGIRNTVIFGGVKQGKQVRALERGVDILVATPGRLLDLMNQGYISLRDIQYFVLDEADQMLDMGFIHDIRKLIAKLPEQRQSFFFSATMPPAIVSLSGKILGSHDTVTVKPEQTTAEKVEQSVFMVSKGDKIKLLTHLVETQDMEAVLVFSRTKHGANKIVKLLGRNGIQAEAIHGNKSQVARQKALGKFKDGELTVLVATDIAARGIDVDDLYFVINYDLPNIPETYVHRIGRTGRAGSSGVAWSFCNVEERAYLKDIQKLIKQEIPVIEDHPYIDPETDPIEKPKPQRNSRSPRRNNSRRPARNDNRSRGSGGGQNGDRRNSGGSRSNGPTSSNNSNSRSRNSGNNSSSRNDQGRNNNFRKGR